MIIKEEIEISIYDHAKRNLHIYLPDNLKDNERLGVLYMFDGHNLFFDEDATYGTSWGLKEFFDQKKPTYMIVGLECNHEGNLRLCEFSPYSFYDPNWGRVEASGKELFNWIINELKPYIDQKYPTLSDRKHTAIGGSSMGGLMALYGSTIHSDIFSKGLALSPYIYHVEKQLLHDIKNARIVKETAIYLSYGSKEVHSKGALVNYTKQLLAIQRAILDRAKLYMHLYPNHTHSESAWHQESRVWYKELAFDKR